MKNIVLKFLNKDVRCCKYLQTQICIAIFLFRKTPGILEKVSDSLHFTTKKNAYPSILKGSVDLPQTNIHFFGCKANIVASKCFFQRDRGILKYR